MLKLSVQIEDRPEAEGVSTSVLTLGVTRLKLVRSTALCFTAVLPPYLYSESLLVLRTSAAHPRRPALRTALTAYGFKSCCRFKSCYSVCEPRPSQVLLQPLRPSLREALRQFEVFYFLLLKFFTFYFFTFKVFLLFTFEVFYFLLFYF